MFYTPVNEAAVPDLTACINIKFIYYLYKRIIVRANVLVLFPSVHLMLHCSYLEVTVQISGVLIYGPN